jgi:ribonuclease P/MRP protein subunit POP7
MKRQLPASASSRIIYVSSSTPFMSAVKRVRKKLNASLRASTSTRAAPRGASLHSRIEGLKRDADNSNKDKDKSKSETEAVTIMGTGKAVEKVVSLAGWFEQQGDCEVEIRTRTVGTVDDVVMASDEEEAGGDSRVRKMSCLEVSVRMK